MAQLVRVQVRRQARVHSARTMLDVGAMLGDICLADGHGGGGLPVISLHLSQQVDLFLAGGSAAVCGGARDGFGG